MRPELSAAEPFVAKDPEPMEFDALENEPVQPFDYPQAFDLTDLDRANPGVSSG